MISFGFLATCFGVTMAWLAYEKEKNIMSAEFEPTIIAFCCQY